MKIGVDVMGGDYAPDSVIQGAVAACREWNDDFRIVLLGDEKVIQEVLVRENASDCDFDIHHCSQVVDMAASPIKALAEKPDSSIAKGFDLLAKDELNGFASAGNTGAMLVGSLFKLGPIREDIRPCLISFLPQVNGKSGVLLDVGAIADTKPETLVDLSILGSTYARVVLGVENPRIALLSIGEEPEKGNMATVAAHKTLLDLPLNFVGNVEGRDLFDGKADVIVTGGFTGNVVVKLAEKFYELAKTTQCHEDPFYSRLNYETYGGSPILGVKKPAVVGHGISSPLAIKNMIRLTYDLARTRLTEQISKALNL